MKLAEPDLVWSWSQETGRKAMLTIVNHVANGKISLTDAKTIMLKAGLIEDDDLHTNEMH